MKKRSKAKRSARKQAGRSAPKVESKPRQLNLMVQVNDPKSIRKDLLEALREVIIFMQGYEAFQKIQEEKVATFAKLREDVKILNSLIHDKLRKHLPKGKLTGYAPQVKETETEPEMQPEPVSPQVIKPQPRSQELDDLEYQLKDIENRLKNLE